MRAVSHLDFIKECNRIHSTPKGLRVNVKCHALLPHYSNVITRFQNNKERAEEGFTTALLEHYQSTSSQLEEKIVETEGAIALSLDDAEDEVKTDHLVKMETTKLNIDKEIKKEEEKKKRKIDTLLQSSNTQNRGGAEKRGRIASRGRKVPKNKGPPRNPKTPQSTSNPSEEANFYKEVLKRLSALEAVHLTGQQEGGRQHPTDHPSCESTAQHQHPVSDHARAQPGVGGDFP